ncbi:hypothetical protein [Actinomadura luteofluorescens]|uniref:hypothetical protein n=1 Tax=Actinomadura luteofluorescens TaxID=46163 RepID=UPI0031D19058
MAATTITLAPFLPERFPRGGRLFQNASPSLGDRSARGGSRRARRGPLATSSSR